MRLAAALICFALLAPAPAAFAADLEPGTLSVDSPGDELTTKVRAQAPELAEGFTQVHHAGVATVEASPEGVRAGSLLWWFLNIVIGQDRMTAQAAEPNAP